MPYKKFVILFIVVISITLFLILLFNPSIINQRVRLGLTSSLGPIESETDENCIGDINNDGIVNILDISAVAIYFGLCDPDIAKDCSGFPECHDSTCYNPLFDLNTDGIINIIDISTVAIQFGKKCEVDLTVQHIYQQRDDTCYLASTLSIYNYFSDMDLSYEDMKVINGHSFAFLERIFNQIGFLEYAGSTDKLIAYVMPELGYIGDKKDFDEYLVIENLNDNIPLVLGTFAQYLWAARGTENGLVDVNELLSTNDPSKFSGHAVVISGYKTVGKDLLLKIVDPGYDENYEYYINTTNFHEFLSNLEHTRTSIFTLIRDETFLLNDEELFYHTLHRGIDAFRFLINAEVYLANLDGTEKPDLTIAIKAEQYLPEIIDFLKDKQEMYGDAHFDSSINLFENAYDSFVNARDPAISDIEKIEFLKEGIENLKKASYELSEYLRIHNPEIDVTKTDDSITLGIDSLFDEISHIGISIISTTDITLTSTASSSGIVDSHQLTSKQYRITVSETTGAVDITINFENTKAEFYDIEVHLSKEMREQFEDIHDIDPYKIRLSLMVE